MGIHQAPISQAAAENKADVKEHCDIAHLHLHFLPPLLRSATVRKFLVGFVSAYYVVASRLLVPLGTN